jgi:signal peptidase II
MLQCAAWVQKPGRDGPALETGGGMRRWLFLAVVIATVLILDQVTKRLVVGALDLGESITPIPALGDFFQLTRSENTGSAFGFLPQAGDIFLVIAVVVVAVMLAFYGRLPERARLTRLGVGLVCAGALGNALDRLEYGAVVDFIHYRIPGVISNVSNLADHAIVFGVIMIFIDSWRSDRNTRDEASDKPSEQTSEAKPQ